jgi:predicted DNA-binding transcriptional regulator YafY
MERFHRYYALHRIFTTRRLPVPRATLERELECSRASVMRVIEDLRNYGAPIEYAREANGYRYAPGKAFELPGIWFSPSELEALFVADHLLEQAEPGLLAETLAPLKQKLGAIFRQEHLGRGELARRVRILRMAGRGAGKYFNLIADALTRRRRLYLAYRSRSRDEATEREVSPQRLVRYRQSARFPLQSP